MLLLVLDLQEISKSPAVPNNVLSSCQVSSIGAWFSLITCDKILVNAHPNWVNTWQSTVLTMVLKTLSFLPSQQFEDYKLEDDHKLASSDVDKLRIYYKHLNKIQWIDTWNHNFLWAVTNWISCTPGETKDKGQDKVGKNDSPCFSNANFAIRSLFPGSNCGKAIGSSSSLQSDHGAHHVTIMIFGSRLGYAMQATLILNGSRWERSVPNTSANVDSASGLPRMQPTHLPALSIIMIQPPNLGMYSKVVSRCGQTNYYSHHLISYVMRRSGRLALVWMTMLWNERHDSDSI